MFELKIGKERKKILSPGDVVYEVYHKTMRSIETCPDCHGKKIIKDDVCGKCDGTGYVTIYLKKYVIHKRIISRVVIDKDIIYKCDNVDGYSYYDRDLFISIKDALDYIKSQEKKDKKEGKNVIRI